MRFTVLFRITLWVFLALVTTVDAKADLSTKQARKLITRMAGIELPNSAVRVERIAAAGNSAAEATAEIQTAFLLTKNQQGRWRVAGVRIGPDRWERLELLTDFWTTEEPSTACDGPDLSSSGRATSDPSTKRARCLIATLLAVQLPSDDVRIKSVSPGLSLTSRPTALVEALISLDFRFARDVKSAWAVTGLRTGSRDWINIIKELAAVNEGKRALALRELGAIAEALNRFRAERRFFVASDSHRVLIDHLSPRYLGQLVRVDPWNEPYRYRGARDSYTLRSLGPDRKENTADDVVVSSPILEPGPRPAN